MEERGFDAEKAVAIAGAVRMAASGGKGGTAVFKSPDKLREASFDGFKGLYGCAENVLYLRDGAVEDIRRAILEGSGEHARRYGAPPVIFAVERLGFFSAAQSKAASDSAAELFASALQGEKDYPARELRRPSAPRPGRLSEKIVIITGSAQGFGRGIAEELAREGANLVIADINEQGAREVAAAINASCGAGAAIAVKVDVSDEASVKAMVEAAVLEYGGLDVMISNAGILRAGSLDEIDLATFELMTRINYTAYFLCAKYASRIMKIQNSFAPGYYTDIIQINSKSGLSGSNRNFAYAGGKFGGIGLTQSFALELVEHRIKVNAICPGNFFEGPLWSDPEKGLFVQYLRAGKVPGAKTVEDVRAFYESKVPMKRGCRVSDVVKAILYIVEQEYETGQAVPVTGGQEMLK